MGFERLTRALRERRPELLREELVGMLIAGEAAAARCPGRLRGGRECRPAGMLDSDDV
jgi:hypothetical protein